MPIFAPVTNVPIPVVTLKSVTVATPIVTSAKVLIPVELILPSMFETSVVVPPPKVTWFAPCPAVIVPSTTIFPVAATFPVTSSACAGVALLMPTRPS